MRQDWQRRVVWFGKVSDGDLRRVLSRIRKDGPLTIRDIDNDVRVEKDYAWGSRKPSKRALEAAFYKGLVTISQRAGMLKTYELLTRHFGWDRLPRAAIERETLNYLLDRALRSQGIVSVESICYQDAPRKLAMRRLVESRVRRKELIPVQVEGAGRVAALGRIRMPSTPFPIRRGNRFISCPPSTRSSSSASDSGSSSTTSIASKLTFPSSKRRIRLFRLPGSDRGSDRCRSRPQNRPAAAKTSGAALELGRPRSVPRACGRQVEAALHEFEQFQLCRI